MDACQNCGKAINQTSNRLVKEACGHNKCRECFLNEEKGCQQCTSLSNNHEPGQCPGGIPVKETITKHVTKQTPCKIKSEWAKMSTIVKERESSSKEPVEIIEIIVSNQEIQNEHHVLQSPIKDNQNPENIPDHSVEFSKNSESRNTSSKVEGKPSKQTKPHLPNHIEELGGSENYKCNICDKILKRRAQISYHLYCDSSEKPFKCNLCSRSFITANHLMYHKETHSGERNHICTQCDKKFKNAVTLRAHIRKTHSKKDFWFKCSKCDQSFIQKSLLVNHETLHNNTMAFNCDKCPKSFRLKENLIKHAITHSEEKKFSCDFCGALFKRNSALKIHKLNHVKNKLKKIGPCKYCGKVFLHQNVFNRHLKTHETGQDLMCPICHAKCKRKDNFFRHLKAIHPEENIQEIYEKVTSTKSTSNDSETEETTLETPPSSEPRSCSVIVCIGKPKPLETTEKEVSGSEPVPPAISLPQNKPLNFQNSMIQNTFINPTRNNLFPQSIFQVNSPKITNDRLEIYRKILLPSREDDEPIITTDQEEDNHRDSTEFIHWRKRTTHNFTQGGQG